jgi:hypothetical protein
MDISYLSNILLVIPLFEPASQRRDFIIRDMNVCTMIKLKKHLAPGELESSAFKTPGAVFDYRNSPCNIRRSTPTLKLSPLIFAGKDCPRESQAPFLRRQLFDCSGLTDLADSVCR